MKPNLALSLIIAAAGLVLIGLLALFVLNPERSSTDAIGGAFTLTDQRGARVTEAALKGQPSLVFSASRIAPMFARQRFSKLAKSIKRSAPKVISSKVFSSRSTLIATAPRRLKPISQVSTPASSASPDRAKRLMSPHAPIALLRAKFRLKAAVM